MFQSGYKPVNALATKLPYEGGFCKWYYIPFEHISSWPPLDPLTQYLVGEPALLEGKTWFGAIKVPNTSIGFEETPKATTAGWLFNQRVNGHHIGDSGESRINLANMLYHEYAIVGRLRAGGLYLLLGSQEGGLTFSQAFKSSLKSEAFREFSFEKLSTEQAFVLTTFLGEDVTPPNDYEPGDPGGIIYDHGNLVEIIPFGTELEKPFAWTSERLSNFGIFPEIQVWATDGANPRLITCDIQVDAAPPSATLFTVYTPGVTGFIVIK